MLHIYIMYEMEHDGKQCVSKNYDKKIYLCVYNYFILYALGLILIMFIRCAS